LIYNNGIRKLYGISEKLYGKDAIKNAEGVLGININKNFYMKIKNSNEVKIEKNAEKGIFGPTRTEKITVLILVLILNHFQIIISKVFQLLI
jgi:hypothetical protein